MEFLPNELIIIIFNYIQKITDKRQFTKTCSKFNNITKKIINNIETSITIGHFKNANVVHLNKYCVEKFTLELCNDNYFNLIPESYLNPNNTVIVKALTVHGQLELLQLAVSNGCSLIKKNRENKLTKKPTWYINNGNDDSNACVHAAISGNLDILQWIKKNKCKFTPRVCANASRYGNLNILKWALENNCPIDKYMYINAGRNGHLHILKYLIKKYNHKYMLYEVCKAAARNGHLDILKWAIQYGHLFDSHTYYAANDGEHFEIINWLKENGCDWNTETSQEIIGAKYFTEWF